MSNVRSKTCVFKNCKQQPEHTLFKFPVDPERFQVWCVNAGLTGNVDLSQNRYLCEKHFSPNYISNQARRKMLVHTAIPIKFNSDAEKVAKVNIVGEPPSKKRKEVKIERYLPTKRKTFSRAPEPVKYLSGNVVEEIVEEFSDSPEEEGESEIMVNKQVGSETYKITEIPKQNSRIVSDPIGNQVYEEITLKPEIQGSKKLQYFVVKPKQKVVEAKPEPVDFKAVQEHQDIFIMEQEEAEEEEAEISTEIVEEKYVESSPTTTKTVDELTKPSEPLESYSEFIFSGEKYVQMPKRVFEEEKEKLRKQAEKYKNLLCKLKTVLNKMDFE